MPENLTVDEVMGRIEQNNGHITLKKDVWVSREHIDPEHLTDEVTWGMPLPEDFHPAYESALFTMDGVDITRDLLYYDSNGVWWTGESKPDSDVEMEIHSVIQYDGLEDAIIGTANPWINGGRDIVLVYSAGKIVDIFMERDGMDYQEALEFIDVNTDGGYCGPRTPIIVYDV